MQGRTGPEFKLTEAQEVRIVQMYQSNHSIAGLAREFRVNQKTIRGVLARAGISFRGRSWAKKHFLSSAQQQEIINAYSQGISSEELGAKFGMSSGTVLKLLRRADVPVRPAGFRSGAGHHAWRGGRVINDDGYVLVLVYPDDPYYCMGQVKGAGADGGRYVLEHRLVMARKLGRPLFEYETVHHKDTDTTNNREDNLQLRVGKHGKGGCFQCVDCGSYNIEAVALPEELS